MHENGYRVFVVVVPAELVENVTHYYSDEIAESSSENNGNIKANAYELIAKTLQNDLEDFFLSWLAETLRLFTWQNGRCDDDFVVTVMHDHHEITGAPANTGDSMMGRFNRVCIKFLCQYALDLFHLRYLGQQEMPF